MPQFAALPRRLSRPSAPSCRGGASSLLRLAQPASRSGGSEGSGWMQRAAAMLAPWPTGSADASFITPLQPSRGIGLR